jgi:spore germination cell wall hydrolase CwlJ-like protein
MLTFSKNMIGTPSLWKSILACAALRLLPLTLLSGAALSLRGQSATVSVSRGEIVAATLILEAGGEADSRAMAAVREVIANRAKNKTELAVCLAPKQFSCWNKIPVERGIEIAKRHPKWSYALALVNQKTNYTSGATHYHAQKVSPSWAKKLAKTVQIGHHIFYK